MLDITVQQLIQAAPVLVALSVQKLVGKAKFSVHSVCHALQGEINNAFQSKDSLFNDENSVLNHAGQKEIKPECLSDFIANPLFSTIVTVPVEPFTPEILMTAELSAIDLDKLGPLFKGD